MSVQVKGIMLSHTCKILKNTSSTPTQESVHVESSHDPSARENAITHLTQMLSFPRKLWATIENTSSQKQS